jgi:hypothetical protein
VVDPAAPVLDASGTPFEHVLSASSSEDVGMLASQAGASPRSSLEASPRTSPRHSPTRHTDGGSGESSSGGGGGGGGRSVALTSSLSHLVPSSDLPGALDGDPMVWSVDDVATWAVREGLVGDSLSLFLI